MLRRATYQSCAVLISLGLLASACSSGDGAGGDGDGNGEPAPSQTTLEVAHSPEPPNLTPYSAHGGRIAAHAPILIPLLRIDSENELYSDSLESWEVSEDGMTVTLYVRNDIEWNDGTPMTSADVLMSLTQYLDSRINTFAQALDGVEGVTEYVDGEEDSISGLSAPDDHTVVVELEQPSQWLAQLAAQGGAVVILPEHILGDVPYDELADHEYFSTFPVTNGPFEFVESVSAQHVEYERSDSWSLGEAGFERLFVKWVEPDVKLAQLEAGEIQLMTDVEGPDAERIASLDGIEIQSAPIPWTRSFSLMHHGPMADRRVRQAMVYAIDRQGICEEVVQGFCTVPATNTPAIGPEWATPTEDIQEYSYDPDRARELLDEAGWDPDTELTALSWQPPGSIGETVLEIVQGNLADVGMNWEIVSSDIATLNEWIEEKPESFNGYPDVFGDFSADPSPLRSMLSCDAHYPGGFNRGLYCNEELDELFDASNGEVDPEQRAEIWQNALRIINEDVPVIFLHGLEDVVAYDERLEGADAHNGLLDVGTWRWEE